MASSPTDSTGEFEFNESQNQLIGSLARKMALVGFVMIFFGLLQMVNGVTSLIMSRRIIGTVARMSGRRGRDIRERLSRISLPLIRATACW